MCMEFAPILFFSFWSLISIVFSAAGMCALHEATIPVSEGVKLLIDYCIALAVNCSLVYAFLFGTVFQANEEFDNRAFWKFYQGVALMLFSAESGSQFLACFKPPEEWNSWDRIMEACLMVFYVWIIYADMKLFSVGFRRLTKRPVFNIWETYPSHLCWIPLQGLLRIFLHGNPVVKHSPSNVTLALLYLFLLPLVKRSSSFARYIKKGLLLTRKILPKKLIGSSSIPGYVYKHRKKVEIACGMLATTVAQYYFRVQSVALMLAFLSLSLAWLGTLAILQPPTDAGILEFFVTSSMQSAVSLFGLHFYTFLVVFGGILLWLLSLEMESIRKLGRFDKTRSWEETLQINIDDLPRLNLRLRDDYLEWRDNWKEDLVSLSHYITPLRFVRLPRILFYYSRLRFILRLFCGHISNTHVNRVQGVPRLNV